jgi:hypothetical protein
LLTWGKFVNVCTSKGYKAILKFLQCSALENILSDVNNHFSKL